MPFEARRVLLEIVSSLLRGRESICRGFESSCIGQKGIVEKSRVSEIDY